MKKILIVTSTLPASDTDPVPAFVRDEAIWLKKIYPELKIDVLAPHNIYSETRNFTKQKYYDEYRFHYFWPYRFEKLTGRGIAPALKANPLLYLQVPFLFVAEFMALWKLVKRAKPDLIYAHWFTPQAIVSSLVSKRTNVPFVFTSHSSDVSVLRKIPFHKGLIARVCEGAIAYTAVSQQTAGKLLDSAGHKDRQMIMKKLKNIPMGTYPMPKPDTKVLEKVVKSYGLKDKKVILFIGRLAHIKGVDYLLSAFAKTLQSEPTAILIIAGEGQELKKLTNLAKRLKIDSRVIFTGHVSGNVKSAIFHLAEVVCIPSIKIGNHSEGLPVVFMEALMAGKIVAASNVSGTPEYINDGVNGFVFPERDPEAMHRTFTKIFNLKSRELRQLKREIVRTSDVFRWDRVAKEHFEFFKNSLK